MMIDLIFDLSDGSESQADVAFGCASTCPKFEVVKNTPHLSVKIASSFSIMYDGSVIFE